MPSQMNGCPLRTAATAPVARANARSKVGDVGGGERGRRIGCEQPHGVVGVLLPEPMERPHPGTFDHLERPQQEGAAVGRRTHNDHWLATFRLEHVPHPGLGPVEGLRSGARRGRLQLTPNRFETLEISGDPKRDRAQARINLERAAPPRRP